MLSEEQIELITERLISRIEKANTYFLKELGEKIKKIKKLTPSQADKLIQILKYGGTYEEIEKKLQKYTGLNIKDIDDILSNYAKTDLRFYEKFYKYKHIPVTQIYENKAILGQIQAISNIVKNKMYDFSRPKVIGYTINKQFYNLRDAYNEVLNTALINVSQGKETFDTAMSSIIKDIGGSGLKTINYESGRAVRLDSAIRMHLQDGLRQIHNSNQQIAGEEFGYNGVEVTHHLNSAPDHIDTVDGKQFALIDKIREQINNGLEKEIKQSDIVGDVVYVKGKRYEDFNAVNNSLLRKVSTLNCQHTIFPIIVGVSQPEYTEEQLKRDKELNEKGFEFEGKHYTMYEGEQKQRQIEREIRKQKDIQMFARSSGQELEAQKAQLRINVLGIKYKELSDVSGLKTRNERLKVSGFRNIKTK